MEYDKHNNIIIQNDLFSGTSLTEQDPETKKIEEKMKKIQKRKKYKDNIKDVELLENIYEQPGAEHASESFVNYENEAFKNYYNSFFQEKNSDTSEIKEPFIEGAQSRRNSNRRKKNAFEKIIDMIKMGSKKVSSAMKKLPGYVDKQFDMNSFMFVNVFSGSNIPYSQYKYGEVPNAKNVPSQKKAKVMHDKEILKNIAYNLIKVPLTNFIMYNWYFLMVYKDTEYSKDHSTPMRAANNEDRMKIDLSLLPSFFETFLGCNLTPVQSLDAFLLGDNWLPFVLDKIPNKAITKFVVFILAYWIVYVLGFLNTYQNLFDNKPSMISIFCIVTSLICLVYSMIKDLSKFDVGIVTNPLYKFALLVIQWSITLSIIITLLSFSSFLVLLFIWVHSLFGIVLYGKGTVTDIIQKIEDSTYSDIKSLRDKELECHEPNFLNRILYALFTFLNKNWNSLFFISIILECMNETKTFLFVKVKSVVLIILSVILGITGLYMFEDYFKKKAEPDDAFHTKGDGAFTKDDGLPGDSSNINDAETIKQNIIDIIDTMNFHTEPHGTNTNTPTTQPNLVPNVISDVEQVVNQSDVIDEIAPNK